MGARAATCVVGHATGMDIGARLRRGERMLTLSVSVMIGSLPVESLAPSWLIKVGQDCSGGS